MILVSSITISISHSQQLWPLVTIACPLNPSTDTGSYNADSTQPITMAIVFLMRDSESFDSYDREPKYIGS